MRILVFSDSHGYTGNIIKALHRNRNIDLVIHLGDMVKDIIKIREQYPDYRYEFVRGNNDWTNECPLEKVIELEGRKIFLTHGHQYNVKTDCQRIISRGHLSGADIVLFGHTHENEELFSEGMLVLNPGSISMPKLGASPTYCLFEFTDDRIMSRFFSTV
jgi:putative phosphoesterase